MRKNIVMILCLMLVMTLLPMTAMAEVPTLTIAIPDNPNVIDWETNEQTLHIQEKLGVELDFVKYPYKEEEYQQKLEMQILAGGNELPDILMLKMPMASLTLYGEMGVIVPLNEYLNDTPYLDEHLATMTANPISKEEFIRYTTSTDGNVYGFGNAGTTPNNSVSSNRVMVYEPWMAKYLEAKGLEEITTPEQFKDMLIYFRDNDMNGNGDANDEIPLLGEAKSIKTNFMRYFMNPYVYTQENYFYNDNGNVILSAATDGWKEGLKFVKSLYDEKLFTDITLTQDSTSFKALLGNETTIVGAAAATSMSGLPASDVRRVEYVIVGALEGPTGLRQVAKTPNLPDIRFAVTKNCKDVALAVKLADYMASTEISVWNRYGIEGKNWIYLPEDQIGKSQYASMGFKGDIKEIDIVWGNPNNVIWCQAGVNIMDGSEMTLRIVSEQKEGNYSHSDPIGAGILRELNYANTENAVFGLIFTGEEQEVINEFQATINSYIEEMFAAFVTGSVDIDAGWDGYVAELNAMGMNDYLKAVNSCWTRMNK